MMTLIKEVKSMYGIYVHHAEFDNARENEDFEHACKQEGMWIQFE